MFKTIVRTTACLAVSAAAFIVITKMDARAGARSKSAPPAEEERKEVAQTKATSMPSAAAPAALPSSARTDADSTLTVPDWKGKRLSVARREARKLGFNIAAFDEEGERVPANLGSGYRVRRQLTAAGTPIAPGGDVELRVREVYDAPSGY
jgi:hypothetical protein